jgi:uncharacterized membrane protein YfbV (UPF0208 family)
MNITVDIKTIVSTVLAAAILGTLGLVWSDHEARIRMETQVNERFTALSKQVESYRQNLYGLEQWLRDYAYHDAERHAAGGVREPR